MAAGQPSSISNQETLLRKAAQIGGAQHLLLLAYGYKVAKVTENTALYLSDPHAHRVTLDAVGHWWVKPEGDREFRGAGFVDLENVLSPGGRML